MGRISEIVVGTFVIGASYALPVAREAILSVFDPGDAALPFNYAEIISYASTGLFYLGVAIIGYAVVRLVGGFAYNRWKQRSGNEEGITRDMVEERRREYLQRQEGQGDQRQRRQRRRRSRDSAAWKDRR